MVTVSAFLVNCTAAWAQESVGAETSSLPCGANCLYSILSFFGIEADYAKLLEECVDRPDGSTMRVLVDTARNYGLHVMPLSDMTLIDIQNSPYPAILYVKKTLNSFKYDHYEVFIPSDSREPILYDPPNESRKVDRLELEERWSGSAILLSHVPISTRFLWWPAVIRLGIIISVVGGIAGMLLVGERKIQHAQSRAAKSTSLQIAWIGVGALVAAFCGNTFLGDGLISRRDEVAQAMKIVPEERFGATSGEELGRAREDGAVLIDARFYQDFVAGHIDGALSVPVDTPDIEIRKRLDGMRRDVAIIVYCQSAACSFDTVIAQKLQYMGFEDVSIYKEGWVEWKRMQEWSRFKSSAALQHL